MKTFATCNPVEFLVQTNKIRRSVEKWLTLTRIREIRKRLPELPENASDEDRKAAMREQVKNHRMTEFLDALSELINDREVIGFFTSLVQLGETGILS